jgi:hypothetical protein
MSYAAAAQDDNEDRYYTQVDAGDVRLFTLDQLDAAFNAGLIHENTYVCLEGASEWLTLGEVAGLGEEEPEAAPISVVAPVPHRTGFAASPSVASASPYGVAPMIVPPSIAPVVNDLSFDFDPDMLAMRPKRRAGKIVAGLVVVGLGALGFAVVSSGGIRLPKLLGGASQASAASLSLGALTDSKPTPRVETPAPAPEAAKPEPPKAEEPKAAETTTASAETKADAKADVETKAEKKSDDRFSEDMKAALLNKDKSQASDQKRKKAARATIATKHKASKPAKAAKGTTGFKAGGSAYDPLNGKL